MLKKKKRKKIAAKIEKIKNAQRRYRPRVSYAKEIIARYL